MSRSDRSPESRSKQPVDSLHDHILDELGVYQAHRPEDIDRSVDQADESGNDQEPAKYGLHLMFSVGEA